MQVGNSSIAALKIGKADKTKSLARARLLPRDLWQTQQWTEATKRVVQDLLVDHGIEVSDEKLGANFRGALLVCAGFVNSQRLSVELNSVHHVGGVLGVGGRTELDEAEALVRLGDAVARHVDVVDGAHLEHDFVDHCRSCALVDVADVDGRLLVLFPGGVCQLCCRVKMGWEDLPVSILRHDDGFEGDFSLLLFARRCITDRGRIGQKLWLWLR